MKRVIKFGLIAVTAMVIVIAVTVWQLHRILYYPISSNNDETIIHVTENYTLDSVADNLERLTNFSHPALFKHFASLKHYNPAKKIGRYNIANLSIEQIVNKLRIGEQDAIDFTFISTRDIGDIIQYASQNLYSVDSIKMDSLLRDTQIVNGLGFTKETLPALFIPNTYKIYWTTNEISLLAKMKQEYQKFWNNERLAKAERIALTPIQVATLASIIDEESSYVPEYRRIAGVYINRLKKGMKLEADPTLKFANNDFEAKRVLDKHKLIDSPYNTYKYAGLPPGPIRVPSLQAIDAVLNAENHDFIFFCANSDFSGTHIFAKTLREHNVNASKYRKALQQRKIYR